MSQKSTIISSKKFKSLNVKKNLFEIRLTILYIYINKQLFTYEKCPVNNIRIFKRNSLIIHVIIIIIVIKTYRCSVQHISVIWGLTFVYPPFQLPKPFFHNYLNLLFNCISFVYEGIQKLVPRLQKYTDINHDYVEK